MKKTATWCRSSTSAQGTKASRKTACATGKDNSCTKKAAGTKGNGKTTKCKDTGPYTTPTAKWPIRGNGKTTNFTAWEQCTTIIQ